MYPSYKRVVVRLFLGDQRVEITKVFYFVFEEANLWVRVVSSSSENSVFEVRPRRTCGLAVCTGLESPRSSSVNSPCRCCGTE